MLKCETEQDGCLQEKNPALIPHYFVCYVDQNLSKEQSDNFLIQELFLHLRVTAHWWTHNLLGSTNPIEFSMFFGQNPDTRLARVNSR